MARKERETFVQQDHQYTSKMDGYLTPPGTPILDPIYEDQELFQVDKAIMPDFDLYTSLEKFNNEDDLFFEFAEDFQDLRLPMLKKDCMWGTAAQIRPSRNTPDSSSDSTTKYAQRSIVTTPQNLIFRSISTTPINFDERTMFTPITSTASTNVNENEQKDIDSSFKVSPTCFLSNSISLLSPNETESEEEIDVVGVPEKPKGDTPTNPSSGTKAVRRRAEYRQAANTISSSSDTDDSSSGRTRNIANQGRVSHNDLERKRRDELKRKFDTLRSVIPDLETNERAPKVLILKKATSFVPRLHEEEQTLVSEKENLKRMNDLLMQRLLNLAKSN